MMAVVSMLPSNRAVAQLAQGASVRIQLDNQELQTLGPARSQVQIAPDDSAPAAAMRDAAPPGRAVPLIFVVVGVLAIPVIWRTLRSMFQQVYYGGVIIDTRVTPISIVHDKAIPSGTVMVVNKSGAAQRFDEQDFSESQLGALLTKGR